MAPESSPTGNKLDSEAEWYVEEGTKKSGPFTAEQLRQLLKAGEIQPNARVSSIRQIGKNLTIMDLLKSLSDPAFTLFEALKATKEKKAAAAIEEAVHEPSSYHSRSLMPPPIVWKVLIGLALVGLLIWALIANLNSVQTSKPDNPAPRKPVSNESTLQKLPPSSFNSGNSGNPGSVGNLSAKTSANISRPQTPSHTEPPPEDRRDQEYSNDDAGLPPPEPDQAIPANEPGSNP